MKSFNEVGLPDPLLQQIQKLGYVTPKPVQSETIPLVLNGKDVLVTAQTGTGKTAAFAIPIISHIINNPNSQALVLLPTRELAIQINKSFKDLIGKLNIKTSLLIGGESIVQQIRLLKQRKLNIIIGTPGRISDHLERKTLKINNVNFLVLDEVDRMLDMGFGIQLEEIKKFLSDNRQTLLFSATLPKNIIALANKYLTEPIRVSLGKPNILADNIDVKKIELQEADKFNQLKEILEGKNDSMIIFVRTKIGADKLSLSLRKLGYKSNSLHGDLRQHKRTKLISAFSNKKYNLLVATGVASRGIDISHIKYVVNYDLPEDPEDYIHRIGRAGRNGEQGYAINFITKSDQYKWQSIQKLMDPNFKITNQPKKSKFRKRSNSGNSFRHTASNNYFRDKSRNKRFKSKVLA